MPDYMFQGVTTLNYRRLEEFPIEDIVTQFFAPHTNINPNSYIPATHTYLGQMLSHELVPATNGTGRAARAKLDLASLYGEPIDYNLFSDKDGKFLTTKDVSGKDFDLFREKDTGKAIIPEERNDENLLVSQMHLFWQRVHNKIAEIVISKNAKYNKEQIVLETRKYVIYLFHRVTVEDFLERLLDEKVWTVFFDQNRQFFLNNSKSELVPLEFSMACFRLGHSLVRPEYSLRSGSGSRKLKTLLRHVKNDTISKDDIVDWAHISKQESQRLDDAITIAMADIPCRPELKVCMGSTQIVNANIKAGIDANLPYAEDVIDQLVDANHDVVKAIELNRQYTLIHENLDGFNIQQFPDGKLPMWLFVLLEANAFGSNGSHLGRFGSLVVAEVLSYCIRQEKNNWFNFSEDEYSLLKDEFDLKQNITFNKINSWL